MKQAGYTEAHQQELIHKRAAANSVQVVNVIKVF
jgi:hypothetical protein